MGNLSIVGAVWLAAMHYWKGCKCERSKTHTDLPCLLKLAALPLGTAIGPDVVLVFMFVLAI